MNIKIRSINFEITPAIDDYINKKISSLEKFFGMNESLLCEVEIGRITKHNSGDVFKAEINIVTPGNKQVYAISEEADLYKAIDMIRDDAEREIVSQKNKKNTLFRRGASQIKNLIKSIGRGK